MSLKKKLKRLKPPPVPGQVKLLSLLAIVLVCAAPALIASIDSNDSTHDLYVERDISSYFADATFSGTWSGKPEGVTLSYGGLVDGNSVVVTADHDDFAGIFRISNIDVSLLTDLAKLELRSSEILKVGSYTSLELDDGSRLPFLNSEDGILTFSPSSIDLIKISNSETFDILVWSVDPSSVIELEFTPYYQYTVPYGEIIIGATGALLLICALMATPWFGIGKIGKRRSKS